MNPQNIKDYVVNKILEKLNEQNEELESLRAENKKLRKVVDVSGIGCCSFCFKGNNLFMCYRCDNFICRKHVFNDGFRKFCSGDCQYRYLRKKKNSH